MVDLLNLARMTVASAPGTGGTVALGVAVPGFLTFDLAGAVDGRTYRYGIKDGPNRELSSGVYTASTKTLTRTVLKSTNANAAINATINAVVGGVVAAEDIGGAFYYQDTAPTTPRVGDRWFDSLLGRMLVYVNDGSSSQWVGVGSGPNSGAILFDQSQALSALQQAQARANIYAAPLDALALAHSNIVVNADHVVSQQFVDASVAAANGYVTDQWGVDATGAVVVSAQRSQSTPPVGFANFLRVTVTTIDASIAAGDKLVIYQPIEGYRIAKLGMGAAGASPVVVGILVRSSVIGTYAFSLRNGAAARSYLANFTINVANAWELKTFSIPGDITGTWVTSNAVGLYASICLSAGSTFQGTNNAWQAGNLIGTASQTNFSATISATFDSTGLIIVPGTDLLTSAAQLPLLMRPYDQELQTCLRYYWNFAPGLTGVPIGMAQCDAVNEWIGIQTFPVPMRIVPAMTVSAVGDVAAFDPGGNAIACTTFNILAGLASVYSAMIHGIGASSPWTTGMATLVKTANANTQIKYNARM